MIVNSFDGFSLCTAVPFLTSLIIAFSLEQKRDNIDEPLVDKSQI